MCRLAMPTADGKAATGAGLSAIQLKVINALSGNLCCTIAADPSWSICRLRTEIAKLEGTPEQEQRLLLPGSPGSAAAALERSSQSLVGDSLAGSEALLLMRVRPAAAAQACVSAADLRPGAVQVSAGGEGEVEPSHVVSWALEARVLLKNSPSEVSPLFQLAVGRPGTAPADFKLILVPQGASSFKASQGRGLVQLKCQSEVEASPTQLKFRVSIAGAPDAGSTELFEHDFARRALWKQDHDPLYLASAPALSSPRAPARRVVVVRLEVFGNGGVQ